MKKLGLLLLFLFLLEGISFSAQESIIVVSQTICQKYLDYFSAGADDYFTNKPVGYSFDSNIKKDIGVRELLSGGVGFIEEFLKVGYENGHDLAKKISIRTELLDCKGIHSR